MYADNFKVGQIQKLKGVSCVAKLNTFQLQSNPSVLGIMNIHKNGSTGIIVSFNFFAFSIGSSQYAKKFIPLKFKFLTLWLHCVHVASVTPSYIYLKDFMNGLDLEKHPRDIRWQGAIILLSLLY